MKQYSEKKRKIGDIFRSLFSISSTAIRVLYLSCPFIWEKRFYSRTIYCLWHFFNSISLLIVSKIFFRRAVFQNCISHSCAIHYCLWNFFFIKGLLFDLYVLTFLENIHQVLWGVFRAQSNIYDRAFCEKAPSQIFDWVLNTPVLTQTSK